MSAVELSEAAMAAWARVSINLSLDRVSDATVHAQAASALTDWDAGFGSYMRYSGPKVYGTVHLPSGWCWVEPGERVLLSASTMTEFAARSALSKFTRTVSSLMDAPGFRRYSVEDWRLLRPVLPT